MNLIISAMSDNESSSSSSSHVSSLCSIYLEELKEHGDISAVSDACPHCGLPGFRHGRKPLVNDNITVNNLLRLLFLIFFVM